MVVVCSKAIWRLGAKQRLSFISYYYLYIVQIQYNITITIVLMPFLDVLKTLVWRLLYIWRLFLNIKTSGTACTTVRNYGFPERRRTECCLYGSESQKTIAPETIQRERLDFHNQKHIHVTWSDIYLI